ncbi:hypothetical protein V6N11_058294 [Hibiscus sabdariffa]|uniref:Uncharacterized protein n=1 Tax=Hibiscus sabdariffa TaxID=183260 RepID=A0ABR2U4L4_9ROSI
MQGTLCTMRLVGIFFSALSFGIYGCTVMRQPFIVVPDDMLRLLKLASTCSRSVWRGRWLSRGVATLLGQLLDLLADCMAKLANFDDFLCHRFLSSLEAVVTQYEKDRYDMAMKGG